MGKKTLIVEDEPDLIKVLELRLNKNQYETKSVTNGKEALEAVKTGEFGLVLLDYYLPDISGLDVFHQIRETELGKELPVIFISASNEVIQKIPNFEKAEKLLKPINADELLALVKKYLG